MALSQTPNLSLSAWTLEASAAIPEGNLAGSARIWPLGLRFGAHAPASSLRCPPYPFGLRFQLRLQHS